MDDTELHARFAGIRLAIAFAIKAASRNPLELRHHVAALQEVQDTMPSSVHRAAVEELAGVIAAVTRIPVRDPDHRSDAEPAPKLLSNPLVAGDLPPDLLS